MILKPAKGKLLNRSHWLSRRLVGAWIFNDNPQVLGQAYDLSGNSNHGTLVGTAQSSPGRFGNGLLLDGDSDFFSASAWTNTVTEFSIVAWINVTGDSPGFAHNQIIDNGEPNEFGFNVTDADNVLEFYSDSLSTKASVGTGSIIHGQWTQVGITYNGAEVRFYINGVGETPLARTGTITLQPTLYLGKRDFIGDERYFWGSFDHILIYDRALLSGEIVSLYRYPFQMFEGSGL